MWVWLTLPALVPRAEAFAAPTNHKHPHPSHTSADQLGTTSISSDLVPATITLLSLSMPIPSTGHPTKRSRSDLGPSISRALAASSKSP
jgi:hypothetical protein